MKKKETIADIVAQMRAAAYVQNADSPQSVFNLADRIEAAEQREVEEWNALTLKVSDFEQTRARMLHYRDELERFKQAVKPLLAYDFGEDKSRKALAEIRDRAVTGVYSGYVDCHEIIEIAEAALRDSAPLRETKTKG